MHTPAHITTYTQTYFISYLRVNDSTRQEYRAEYSLSACVSVLLCGCYGPSVS